MKRVALIITLVLYVLGIGSMCLAATTGTPKNATAAKQSVTQKNQDTSNLIDINTCDKSALTGLGISDKDADKIIKNRPYKMKSQIKKYIPTSLYDRISGQIVAKKAKKK